MDSTLSVSKGCFVFKNGATRAHKPSKKLAERMQRLESNSLLGEQFIHKPSYRLYERTWKKFLQNVDKLQRNSYFRTLENLVTYVTSNNCSTPLRSFGVDEILPAAALLTGINQPDHLEQFEALSQGIKERTDASVCILQSRDCPTIKAAIETMVYNFVEAPYSDDEERSRKRLRRSQCTMKQLHQWYTNNYGTGGRDAVSVESSDAIAPHIRRHILVVILPDFECFGTLVLQDIVLILSSYFARLPFVLIMGVATAVSAVHSTLPYHVMSKLKLRVFQTQTAAIILNEIIDKALLSLEMHFHLSGKTLKFLTHIFLYYDFSINGFIQGFKYCLVEHLLQGKSYALCDNYANNLSLVRSLTHDDLETIRSLPSFRSYAAGISDTQSTTSTLMDDNYLKQQLPQLLRNCHEYFILFRVFLEFLVALVADLPKCPLGKQRYELYSVCMSKEVTAQTEFKECWQILRLMCKDEFVAKFNSAILAAKDLAKIKDSLHYETDRKIFNVVDQKLSQVDELIKKVISAGTDMQRQQQEVTSTKSEQLKSRTRQELKEKLLQMSKVKKHTSEFGQSVNKTLGYVLEEIISKHLRPLSAAPLLHELFVFSDISKVLRNILGAPRAALHMALNNPQFYIQCECCNLSKTSQLLNTLPDLSVAYKLHMECGRMINLFDWLQAFNSVLNTEENDQEQIDPQIQARFTRAVAELQFLGYIKMSKRKTDHATRLTW